MVRVEGIVAIHQAAESIGPTDQVGAEAGADLAAREWRRSCSRRARQRPWSLVFRGSGCRLAAAAEHALPIPTDASPIGQSDPGAAFAILLAVRAVRPAQSAACSFGLCICLGNWRGRRASQRCGVSGLIGRMELVWHSAGPPSNSRIK